MQRQQLRAARIGGGRSGVVGGVIRGSGAGTTAAPVLGSLTTVNK